MDAGIRNAIQEKMILGKKSKELAITLLADAFSWVDGSAIQQ